MNSFSREQLESVLTYDLLIEALREAFRQNYTVPMRHHHDFKNPQEGKDSTLLLMPAWEAGKYLGVKMITVSPNNGQYNLPAIQGMYVLFDAHKGTPLALMDAPTLTALRTAAASALAASYLAATNSKTLLMIGTGRLAPELIKAHCATRPIEQVYIWGRNEAKAHSLAATFTQNTFAVKAVSSIEAIIQKADIISLSLIHISEPTRPY